MLQINYKEEFFNKVSCSYNYPIIIGPNYEYDSILISGNTPVYGYEPSFFENNKFMMNLRKNMISLSKNTMLIDDNSQTYFIDECFDDIETIIIECTNCLFNNCSFESLRRIYITGTLTIKYCTKLDKLYEIIVDRVYSTLYTSKLLFIGNTVYNNLKRIIGSGNTIDIKVYDSKFPILTELDINQNIFSNKVLLNTFPKLQKLRIYGYNNKIDNSDLKLCYSFLYLQELELNRVNITHRILDCINNTVINSLSIIYCDNNFTKYNLYLEKLETLNLKYTINSNNFLRHIILQSDNLISINGINNKHVPVKFVNKLNKLSILKIPYLSGKHYTKLESLTIIEEKISDRHSQLLSKFAPNIKELRVISNIMSDKPLLLNMLYDDIINNVNTNVERLLYNGPIIHHIEYYFKNLVYLDINITCGDTITINANEISLLESITSDNEVVIYNNYTHAIILKQLTYVKVRNLVISGYVKVDNINTLGLFDQTSLMKIPSKNITSLTIDKFNDIIIDDNILSNLKYFKVYRITNNSILYFDNIVSKYSFEKLYTPYIPNSINTYNTIKLSMVIDYNTYMFSDIVMIYDGIIFLNIYKLDYIRCINKVILRCKSIIGIDVILSK